MEASGNEYVAQLLDRAATLIKATGDGTDTDRTEHEQWLREYQAEKARFGQPLGSPAYANAKQAARAGEDLETQGADGDRYDDMSLSELQSEAGGRNLPKSGNKTDLAERLREDDRAAQV